VNTTHEENSKMKRALITGLDGQDGSFLAELLLSKGYEVHGLIRRGVNPLVNIEHLRDTPIVLHYGDLATENHLMLLIAELTPHEIYHLAGQSDVAASFEIPEYTGDITGLGVTRLLEAIRRFSPRSKLYQASSSEMFGNAPPPQNEETPFTARSPYGAAKIYAHNMVRCYREAYGLFASCGILFNHESERRGLNFVTRKISNAAARISLGLQDKLELGNMTARRDWGYSPDYVRAMWMMLQQDEPSDYVVGTGKIHSVQDFVAAAFGHVGLDWQDYVVGGMASSVRPSDISYLLADPTKANYELGWTPRVWFDELVTIMVDHDLKLNKEGK